MSLEWVCAGIAGYILFLVPVIAFFKGASRGKVSPEEQDRS